MKPVSRKPNNRTETVIQATVYDDQHLGDFVDVVVNFTNQETEHTQGGVRLYPEQNISETCHQTPAPQIKLAKMDSGQVAASCIVQPFPRLPIPAM